MAPPPYKLWGRAEEVPSPPVALLQPGQLISLGSSIALGCTFFRVTVWCWLMSVQLWAAKGSFWPAQLREGWL